MVVGTNAYIIRPANNVEEASAFWWPLIKGLGWNRDHDDAKPHFRAADNGKNWLLLIHATTSQAEGCVIPFIYPNRIGWVGFFVMSADFRGRGLGGALWKEMEATFKDSGVETIGLDSVQEQLETYKRRGFKQCALIPLMTRESLKTKPLNALSSSTTTTTTDEIKDIKAVDPSLIANLDLQHTGLDRSAYWKEGGLLDSDHAFGYAIFSSSHLTGFVLVRRCENGHRIGPLYADSPSQARQLLHKAMSRLQDSDGSLDAEIFGTNTEAQKVFEDLGWTYADVSYHRMWLHGKVPAEQQEGGRGAKGMFAIFDAGSG